MDMAAGKCKAAFHTDEWHGYGCDITGGPCMFLFPDSRACAELYGEGPDVIRTDTGTVAGNPQKYQDRLLGDETARLTEKKASGTWQVKGIAWEELREGKVIKKEMSRHLYGCLCKLKDYEDTGMSPDQMRKWWYELEDMAGHVCDDLCRYSQELTEQDEIEEMCEFCPVSTCRKRLLEVTK